MKKILGLLIVAFVFSSLPVYAKMINMTVTDKGYEPSSVDVKAGEKVVLKITRKTDETCATEIKIPAKKINTPLPLNKEVTVEVGPLDKGDVGFSCGMDMIKGVIHVK